MAGEVRARAVLLDAMGTLLRLEDPAPRLRAALRERLGVDVGAEAAAAAMRAEITYYRAHLHLGRDAASVDALRASCAEAMRPALRLPTPGEELTAALLDAIELSAYPDAAPALQALRAAGRALVVVSNWDFSLHERLERAGLRPLVDGVVASAEAGAAKPEPAIFERALDLVGAAPQRAWHVGDSLAEDVCGARAAGLRAVLVARDGTASRGGDATDRAASPADSSPAPAGVPVVATLDALPALVTAADPYP